MMIIVNGVHQNVSHAIPLTITALLLTLPDSQAKSVNINGKFVAPQYWDTTTIKEGDDVIIITSKILIPPRQD